MPKLRRKKNQLRDQAAKETAFPFKVLKKKIENLKAI